jgi:hypothetical protein
VAAPPVLASNILNHPHAVFIIVVGFAEAGDEATATSKIKIVRKK